MASVEMLGLLCAGSTRYHEYAAGGSAGERLSRSELAGLLAGLDSAAMNFALAKYTRDLDAERLLIAHVRVWAAGLAVRESWQIIKGRPTVVNMAALAVIDVVRPNRCCRCAGRSYLANRVCPACQGTGYKPLSGRKIGLAIGVDECNYRRVWKFRYGRCLGYVQGIDSKINGILRNADRDPVFSVC